MEEKGGKQRNFGGENTLQIGDCGLQIDDECRHGEVLFRDLWVGQNCGHLPGHAKNLVRWLYAVLGRWPRLLPHSQGYAKALP